MAHRWINKIAENNRQPFRIRSQISIRPTEEPLFSCEPKINSEVKRQSL